MFLSKRSIKKGMDKEKNKTKIRLQVEAYGLVRFISHLSNADISIQELKQQLEQGMKFGDDV
jgi:hypothetical protein